MERVPQLGLHVLPEEDILDGGDALHVLDVGVEEGVDYLEVEFQMQRGVTHDVLFFCLDTKLLENVIEDQFLLFDEE